MSICKGVCKAGQPLWSLKSLKVGLVLGTRTSIISVILRVLDKYLKPLDKKDNLKPVVHPHEV